MKDYEIFSNIGNREVNEDNVNMVEKNGTYCFVLADGLGGHGRGDEASEVVVNEVLKQFMEYEGSLDSFVGMAIDKAQLKLMEEQTIRHAKFQMKTTVVVLVVNDTMAYWGHVGDSRLYMFKGHRVKTRTIDHSVPQMLVLSKSIKESEIRNHPDRNKLLRVMGIKWEDSMYELSEMKLRRRQAFLLCSDGFWELIEEKEMQNYLKVATSAKDWMNMMVEEVAKNGVGKNMDNFSAIAVIL